MCLVPLLLFTATADNVSKSCADPLKSCIKSLPYNYYQHDDNRKKCDQIKIKIWMDKRNTSIKNTNTVAKSQ